MKKDIGNRESIRDYLKPETSDHYVGIEIEFYCKQTQQQLLGKLAESDICSIVTLQRDGSIQPPAACGRSHDECDCDSYYEGHELCVLTKQADLRANMKAVGAFLKEVGAKVNSSCGLHVHLDMRNRSPVLSYKRLFAVQDLMFRMIPSRRRKSHYAARTQWANFATARDRSRFTAINASSYDMHQTLEVRVHQGSVKVSDITQWVEFLVAAIEVKRTPTAIQSTKHAVQRLKLSKRLGRYIQLRTERYSKERKAA